MPGTACHWAIPVTREYSNARECFIAVTYALASIHSPKHPVCLSHSNAQMANTLCSIYTAGQWSRAHYLHYLQRQMDKLLQWPSLQCICNVEEELSPALMLAGAGKSKFQSMKWLFTAASFILKCYQYNHTWGVIHMPVLLPEPSSARGKHKMYWLETYPFQQEKWHLQYF